MMLPFLFSIIVISLHKKIRDDTTLLVQIGFKFIIIIKCIFSQGIWGEAITKYQVTEVYSHLQFWQYYY